MLPLLEHPSQGEPRSSDEMSPLHLSDVLRRVRCTAIQQLTPPLSPVNGCQPPARSRNAPGLQMNGLFSRRGSRVKKTKNPSKVKLHFRGQTACSTLRTLAAEMGDAGVPQGIVCRDSAVAPEHCDAVPSLDATPALELRRITDSYFDLRSLAHVQQSEQHIALSDMTPHHTPLLPSPIIDERRMKPHKCSSDPLRFENPRHVTHSRKESSYKSYEDMQILSCYEDSPLPPATSRLDIDHKGNDVQRKVAPVERSQSSPQTPNIRRKVIPPSSGQSFGSPESDWLANTTSHQQRLRKFNAQCYQVTQPSFRESAVMAEEEGQVMMATVLVGHGKPKLVQIQRPTSSDYSSESRRHSNQSVQSSRSETRALNTPPSTPVRQHKEVSAFSPYDTPSVVTPFTDITGSACTRNNIPEEQHSLTVSKLDLVPRPLGGGRRDSGESDGTVFSTIKNRLDALSPKFSISPATSYGLRVLTASTPATSWSSDDAIDLSPRLNKRVSFGSAATAIDEKLHAITLAVQEFPNTLLGLNSTVVRSLRKRPNNSKDEMHLRTLSRIFTNTPKQLLDWLAAWIIIDLYVSSLQADYPADSQRRVSSPTIVQSPKTFASQRSASFGSPKPQRAIYKLFPLPPGRVFKQSSSLPIKNYSAHTEAELDSIPTKARSILGLAKDQTSRLDQQVITTRAKALSLSVGVIAQKLMEGLRGERGWDAELWRALGIVINATEEADVDAHGNGNGDW